MKWFAVLAVTGSWALAQQPPAQSGASSPAAREELERTLAATVNSPLEYLRTIENTWDNIPMRPTGRTWSAAPPTPPWHSTTMAW